tara:strand:+ start:924 stop:1256 length:333 start_codon:yes stop_codon:yes gene_type:complete
MTVGGLVIKILAIGLTIYFIISGIQHMNTETSFFVFVLKFILIFLALPVLYLFKILNYFNIDIPIRRHKWANYEWTDHESNFFQAKLFYKVIYAIIFILIIIRLVEQLLG